MFCYSAHCHAISTVIWMFKSFSFSLIRRTWWNVRISKLCVQKMTQNSLTPLRHSFSSSLRTSCSTLKHRVSRIRYSPYQNNPDFIESWSICWSTCFVLVSITFKYSRPNISLASVQAGGAANQEGQEPKTRLMISTSPNWIFSECPEFFESRYCKLFHNCSSRAGIVSLVKISGRGTLEQHKYQGMCQLCRPSIHLVQNWKPCWFYHQVVDLIQIYHSHSWCRCSGCYFWALENLIVFLCNTLLFSIIVLFDTHYDS